MRPLQVNGTATPPTQLERAVDIVPAWVPTWAVQAVLATLVLAFSVLIGRLIVRAFGRRIAQRFERPSITRAVIRGIRVGALLFGLLIVLRIFGLQLSDITLQITVISAIVGVVLAPIVGSFISGLFLLADQPYEIGDMIELTDSGQQGFVEDITLRYTKVFTLDNTFLVIPNGSMRDRDVANYSAEDTRTRLSLSVLVTYESDVAQARKLIERAARQVDSVIEGGPDIRVGAARYPAGPTCYIDEFADHGVLLTLRYWVNEPYKLLATRSAVQTNVWEALADADVEIAYPHSHLHFDETTGTLPVSVGDGTDGPRTALGGHERGVTAAGEGSQSIEDRGTEEGDVSPPEDGDEHDSTAE